MPTIKEQQFDLKELMLFCPCFCKSYKKVVNSDKIHRRVLGFRAVLEGKPRRRSRLYVQAMRVTRKQEEVKRKQ